MNRNKRVTMVAVACTALTSFGCGSSNDESSGGTAGGGGNDGDGGGASVQLDVAVITFEPGLGMNVPFEGAEVCVGETDTCATSDAEGNLELTVPADSEIELLASAEDYTPVLTPVTTGDENQSGVLVPLISEATVELLSGVLGTPYPPGENGIVALSVLVAPVEDANNGIAGVTVTPDREAEVYYLDENELPSYELTETTYPSGVGGMVEVAPGTWELTLGGTASNCIISAAWPGSSALAFRLPVRAGYFTQGFVTCDPVP